MNRAAQNRDARQRQCREWTERCFGGASMMPIERLERFLEEAVELAQAGGMSAERVAAITAHVYAKPPGEPAQEVGGVGVTLLAYCEAEELSADGCEERELTRILNKPVEHFRARHAIKLTTGLAQPVAAGE